MFSGTTQYKVTLRYMIFCSGFKYKQHPALSKSIYQPSFIRLIISFLFIGKENQVLEPKMLQSSKTELTQACYIW